MQTIILGLGNPILGDDGIGCRVAQEIEQLLAQHSIPNLEIDQFYRGGIALMERLIGFDKAVLVDAIETNNGKPGSIYRLKLDDLPTRTTNSIHDASLKTAIALGNKLGGKLPADIVIIAIEAEIKWEFSEELSPSVQASVTPAVQAVLKELNLDIHSSGNSNSCHLNTQQA